MSAHLIALTKQIWGTEYPKMTADLRRRGILGREARKAADRAAEMMADLMQQGLRPDEAQEVAVAEVIRRSR